MLITSKMVKNRHFARFIGVLFPVGIRLLSFYVMNAFLIGIIYIGIWAQLRVGERDRKSQVELILHLI